MFSFQLFFILRKKNQQVSTLHVIHHGIMPFSVWMGLKFAPGGHSTFFALLNTFVHIIMYFYYMLSAMGPQYQKYLWWKKYLTSLQMVSMTAFPGFPRVPGSWHSRPIGQIWFSLYDSPRRSRAPIGSRNK